VKLKRGEPLYVALATAPETEVRVGRLALEERGRAAFGYDDAFIASGARIQPVWPAPDGAVIHAAAPRVFTGLHGIFADSLPDAWGLEIMRRRVAAQGIAYDALSRLDRLALVGHTGVGALVYRPDYADADDGDVDLDALADGAAAVLDGTETSVVEELAKLGGSSGGARPKVFVARNAAGHTVPGTVAAPPGYVHYIVKFRGRTDVRDIGPLEAAYADMARAAGVDVSPTTLIPASSGPGYFATQRFDRIGASARTHVLSIAAIFELDWSEPSLDYEQLIAIVFRLTHDAQAAEQMFRRMVFNAFAVNRDDHTKQHALLQHAGGTWTLAPAFDLTLSPGPNNQHYLAINGKGNGITVDDVVAVARAVSIRAPRAKEIVDDVRTAVAQFPALAATYGVSKASLADFTSLQAT
jgi:serine/threonine-protein kinase HipA